jgi:Transposase, Mutator family
MDQPVWASIQRLMARAANTMLRWASMESRWLGIGIDGTKHPLAVEEGSTENATLVTDLITGLRERGLDVTKPVLAVLDGAKALSRAVKPDLAQLVRTRATLLILVRTARMSSGSGLAR